jgi:hypothetical protein
VLLTGIVPAYIAERLAAALITDQKVIDEVITATNLQRHAETAAQQQAEAMAYHEAFRPHLRAETERRVPQPIHGAAMFGTVAMRIVTLPERVWIANELDRDLIVKRAIRAHYRNCQGKVPTFGKITSYMLVLGTRRVRRSRAAVQCHQRSGWTPVRG